MLTKPLENFKSSQLIHPWFPCTVPTGRLVSSLITDMMGYKKLDTRERLSRREIAKTASSVKDSREGSPMNLPGARGANGVGSNPRGPACAGPHIAALGTKYTKGPRILAASACFTAADFPMRGKNTLSCE